MKRWLLISALVAGFVVTLAWAAPRQMFSVYYDNPGRQFHVVAPKGGRPTLQFDLYEYSTNKYIPSSATALYKYQATASNTTMNVATGSVSSNTVTINIPASFFTNTMERRYAVLLLVETSVTNTFARGEQTIIDEGDL